jgi:hypothetical protein
VARRDERAVDGTRERNSLVAIGWLIAPQHTESIKPHGEIVEILPIAVGLFPDTNAALPPKHAGAS